MWDALKSKISDDVLDAVARNVADMENLRQHREGEVPQEQQEGERHVGSKQGLRLEVTK